MENNYEQKYKKALDNARLMYDAGNNDVKHIVGQLFPELAESEDEKVRKEIIRFIRMEVEDEIVENKWLAWLGKQKGNIGGISSNSEWSEEDEDMRYKAKAVINRLCAEGKEYVWSIETLKKIFNWLNFLKDRVQPQPKQEWSEEDINMINWLIRCCEEEHKELCNDKYGHQDIVSDLKRDCRKKWDWLESLKNRVGLQDHWKPSDEQIKAIRLARSFVVDDFGEHPMLSETLMELEEQLKILKEE